MSANITLTSPSLGTDGKTLTATLSGGTGTGYTIDDSTGFTINAGGLRHTIAGQDITGATLTLTLGFPVGAGWTGCTVSTTTGTSIEDDGGNTSQAQTDVAFTNNSTVTLAAYGVTDAELSLFGIYADPISTGGRSLMIGASSGAGIAFSATGTDVAVLGFPFSGTDITVSVDGGSLTPTAVGPSSIAGVAALVPVATGMADAAHEIVIETNNSYLDRGTAASAGTVQATILIAGATPSADIADGGDRGTRYFLGDAPFTDASGSGTKGILERYGTGTYSIGGKTGYNMNPGAAVRFRTNSTFVAIFCTNSSQTYALYRDGVYVDEVSPGAAQKRVLVADGLSGTHEYEIVTLSLTPADSFLFYVELNGSGIIDAEHVPRLYDFEFGDSRTRETTFVSDARDGHFWAAAHPVGNFAAWNVDGGGRRISNDGGVGVAWFSDHAVDIPADVDRVLLPAGVNDVTANELGSQFQDDYQLTLEEIRAQIGPDKTIFAFQPLPYMGDSGGRATAGTAIQAAIAATADADVIYIPTDNWIDADVGHMPDTLHLSAAGAGQYANRLIPLLAEEAITISGPSVGGTGLATSNFTVTLAGGATFTGDQEITITSDDAGATITPSVGAPDTGSVAVTPADGATSFTFTVTPSVSGTQTLTATSDQAGWVMPVAWDLEVNDSVVESVTVSPATATLYGGETQQFTAVVDGIGSPPQTVTWSVTSGPGSIDSEGLYTAPGGLASGDQAVVITAASTQDPSFTDTAAVTVPEHSSAGGVFTITVQGNPA